MCIQIRAGAHVNVSVHCMSLSHTGVIRCKDAHVCMYMCACMRKRAGHACFPVHSRPIVFCMIISWQACRMSAPSIHGIMQTNRTVSATSFVCGKAVLWNRRGCPHHQIYGCRVTNAKHVHHTCTRTFTNVRTHVHRRTHTQMHVCTHTRMHMRTYMHTQAHAHTCADVCKHARVCTHGHVHRHMHAHMRMAILRVELKRCRNKLGLD